MPFESPDIALKSLLENTEQGKIQLPDFQREWKWDDDRIRSLLASITLDYPIGVLMSLQVSEELRFRPRLISGVEANGQGDPDELLLDGQQRMTSLFQALQSGKPVQTTDAKKKKISRWYYLSIAESLDPDGDREEAIKAVPEDRILREDFGRTVKADYSDIDKECEAEMFPLRNAFDMGALFDWQNRYIQLEDVDGERRAARWQRFYNEVFDNLVRYEVPVIVLTKETPKEAVCTVFEKVNTGGIVLNVFELLTATFAADDFRLNDDWKGRKAEMAKQPVLKDLESTDFLQAISLVVTARRHQERGTGAVSCRRKDILNLELEDYKLAAGDVTASFTWVAEFLAREKIFQSKDVPYRTQMVPLAALRALVGPAIDDHGAAAKLRRWYWCGVLGELYGGAAETRFARDVEEVPGWLEGGEEPRTVTEASFEASRLETLRTRNSAAYKGLYALLMRGGARDWIKNREIDLAGFFDLSIDIHHVFPRKWCDDNGVDGGRRDSIINKTPLSWDTNRSIGGRPPSSYLGTIQTRCQLSEDGLDELLEGHLVPGDPLRADDFETYYADRKSSLIKLIAEVTEKEVRRDDLAPEGAPDYEPEEDPADPGEELAAGLASATADAHHDDGA